MASSRGSQLPPPLRPTATRTISEDDDSKWRRGSLSDFSDYVSSDEETHNRASTSTALRSRNKDYVTSMDDHHQAGVPNHSLLEEEDPFADPFAD